MLGEIISGVTASLAISPIMTVLDTAIIRAQFDKTSLGKAVSNTSRDLISGKMKWNPSFNIMWRVYASTYLTANCTKRLCEDNSIDYKLPTAVSTSVVNIIMIGQKDRAYATIYSELFKTQPKVFPKLSYLLFACRDGLTVTSSFVIKNTVKESLEKNYGLSSRNADLAASFSVPMIAQVFATPFHILALDKYERSNVPFANRLALVSKSFASVCSGRALRIVPAFGLGGYLNDVFKEAFHSDDSITLPAYPQVARMESSR